MTGPKYTNPGTLWDGCMAGGVCEESGRAKSWNRDVPTAQMTEPDPSLRTPDRNFMENSNIGSVWAA